MHRVGDRIDPEDGEALETRLPFCSCRPLTLLVGEFPYLVAFDDLALGVDGERASAGLAASASILGLPEPLWELTLLLSGVPQAPSDLIATLFVNGDFFPTVAANADTVLASFLGALSFDASSGQFFLGAPTILFETSLGLSETSQYEQTVSGFVQSVAEVSTAVLLGIGLLGCRVARGARIRVAGRVSSTWRPRALQIGNPQRAEG